MCRLFVGPKDASLTARQALLTRSLSCVGRVQNQPLGQPLLQVGVLPPDYRRELLILGCAAGFLANTGHPLIGSILKNQNSLVYDSLRTRTQPLCIHFGEALRKAGLTRGTILDLENRPAVLYQDDLTVLARLCTPPYFYRAAFLKLSSGFAGFRLVGRV